MSDLSGNAALIQEALVNAITHHQAGRLGEAEALYRAILQLDAGHADANHNLGLIAAQLGQPSAALPFFKAALSANPGEPGFWHIYLDTLLDAGESTAAHALAQLGKQHGIAFPDELQRRLALASPLPAPPSQQPTDAETQALSDAFQKRDFQTLEALGRATVRRYPHAIAGWRALSLACFNTGRYADALEPTLKMAALQPDDAQMHANLGLVFWQLRRLDEAEASLERAIRLAPDISDTHTNLGNVRKDQGRFEEAMNCYRRAIALDPGQAIPYSNLAVLLIIGQAYREAEKHLRAALQLEPDNPYVLRSLATALTKLGNLVEAEAVIRRAIAVDPDNVLAYDLLLFLFNYTHTDKSREARVLAEHYGQLVARRRTSRCLEWQATPDPKRLRVGLVSADLKNHPVGLFVESLLHKLDPTSIELIAYVHMPEQHYDEVTARMQPRFAAWKSIYHLSDQDTALLIQTDGVHVLLDMSGHTTDNRLPVFAYKPAPVQASWLGYFATTGVAEMDYLIGDPWLCPPEEEDHFTEAVWRLPQTWLSFTPPQEDIPVAPLPALSSGHITFGCCNNLNKMNDAVVALWSRLLKRLPNARLLLKAPQLGDPDVRTETLARFTAQGVAADQVLLEGPSPRMAYLSAYAQIDVALDPFPYPGGATSVDALWMGVPVLTLRGNRFLSHLGESVAHNAGLPEWIASSEDDYLEKAIACADDLQALSELRAALRERLQRSPLLDTEAFARGFEQAMWQMWRDRGTHAERRTADSIKTTAAAGKQPPLADIQQLDRLTRQGPLQALEKRSLEMTRKYPGAAVGWRALGTAQQRSGRFEDALKSIQRLLALQPNDAAAHADQGYLQIRSGRLSEAEASLRKAIALAPAQADPYINLGYIFRARGDLDGAVASYRQALEINPSLGSAHANLGTVLLEQGFLRSAEASLRRALELSPRDAGALLALGSTLVKLGSLAEAEALIRRLLKLDPENAHAYSILLFALNYDITEYRSEALALARNFGAMLSKKSDKQRYTKWNCETDPQKLRVGLVSGDLFNHPVGYFLEGLLGRLNQERIEVYAYSNRPERKEDAMSERLRSHCAAWKLIDTLDDAAAAALIHADGVHVLLDLAGHTGNTRLPLFAYKPAPIQAAWLGYFATTGVEQMDYLIGDPNVCPPEEEHHFTETIWRLPETYLCFTPPDADVETGALPAHANGYVTFGCFNNIGKLNDNVIRTWSRILHQVPNSRLLLKARQLGDTAVCQWLRERFAAQGVADDRLLLEGPTPRLDYLQAYQCVDIVLDPFPYPGGTTTVEALWMSVPVLTLEGNRMLSHAGENILRNVGLPEWIAADESEYIAKAKRFAADLDILSALRTRLRDQAVASPMFDAPRFARHFETALWGMWQNRRHHDTDD